MATHSRFVPLIVAFPLLLQNIDLSALTVALPDMAISLHVPPIQLSAIVACYAISLAAFLPLSAWLTDRFGTKRTFCSAIIVFVGASVLCGTSHSAGALIAYRVLQGLGAAMMVPVGRLILLRSVPAADLVMAMVWFTIPPAFGRLVGPLVGGAIVTYVDWRWIFFVNIPLGALTLFLALALIETDSPPEQTRPLDVPGFLLIAMGLGMTLAGLETIGKQESLPALPWILTGVGFATLAMYAMHSLRLANPVIDLRILKYNSFRTNVLGAAPFRIAISGAPFLLPLMMQLGFGFSALSAGIVSAFSAAGSITTRVIMRRAIRMISFKRLLMVTTGLSALCLCSYGIVGGNFRGVPIEALVFIGGLVTSLCMVSLNTLGFVEIPAERTSHATALLAMTQQVTSALGVVLAAMVLRFAAMARSGSVSDVGPLDFTIAFASMGLCALMSVAFFARLASAEDGGLSPSRSPVPERTVA